MNTLKPFLYLLILAAMAAIASCPETVDPPEKRPPGVRIIPYDGDTSSVESGIRAEAGPVNAIRLEWNPVEDVNFQIDEYRIFRKDQYDSVFRYVANVPPDQNVFLDQFGSSALIGVDTVHAYMVTAVDSRNRMSDTSHYFDPDSQSTYVVNFRLGYKIRYLLDPNYVDTVVTTKPTFVWCLGRNFPLPGRYILKVADPNLKIVYVAQVPARNYEAGDCDLPQNPDHLTFHPETYAPNDTLRALDAVTVHYTDPVYVNGTRLKKGNYFWRVDGYYGPNYESKSNWMAITINRD